MSNKSGFKITTITLNPIFIIAVMTAGGYVGINFPQYSKLLGVVGDMYLAILQMCVMPIMLCAVATSIGKLIRTKQSDLSISKIVVIFCLGMVLAASLGIASGVIGKPGLSLGEKAQNTLGDLVNTSEYGADLVISYDNPVVVEREKVTIIDFLSNLVPSNVFASMSQGESLKVLFFAMLLGLALGFISAEPASAAFEFFNAIFEAMTRIINWAMHGLPIGLFCLVAKQMSTVGLDILGAMFRLVIVIHVVCLIFLAISLILVSIKTKTPIWRTLAGLKNTAMVAFGTRSSFASIPAAIDELQRNFGVSNSSASLLVPLGFTVFRFGTVMMFALAAVFMGQLYEVNLTPMTLAVALLSSLLAGAATAGAPGLVALSMLSFVLGTLGLPFDTAFVLLLAIDPITDPILTLVNVNINCAATVLSSSTKASVPQEAVSAPGVDTAVSEGV